MAEKATQILSGWKEIANYPGKGVRTVQRYERGQHLPIHRPAGKSVSVVIAIQAELDRWITGAAATKQIWSQRFKPRSTRQIDLERIFCGLTPKSL